MRIISSKSPEPVIPDRALCRSFSAPRRRVSRAAASDEGLRLGSRLQPFDVLAVGVDQQDGDHEREHHEGRRSVDFGRYEGEDGEAASGDHRGQRHVVRDHQHHQPHAEAQQRHGGIDARHGAHERRDALSAAESGENREDCSANLTAYLLNAGLL